MENKEALEYLFGLALFNADEEQHKKCREANKIIQEVLEQKEKQDKILEILKKKNVYMFRINNCINAEEYNEWVGINVDDELTEEEFNLIKGVVR